MCGICRTFFLSVFDILASVSCFACVPVGSKYHITKVSVYLVYVPSKSVDFDEICHDTTERSSISVIYGKTSKQTRFNIYNISVVCVFVAAAVVTAYYEI